MLPIDYEKLQSLYDKFNTDQTTLTDNELFTLKSYMWLLEARTAIVKAQACIEWWNYHKNTHILCFDVLAVN